MPRRNSRGRDTVHDALPVPRLGRLAPKLPARIVRASSTSGRPMVGIVEDGVRQPFDPCPICEALGQWICACGAVNGSGSVFCHACESRSS
jgi:hypothetical protein